MDLPEYETVNPDKILQPDKNILFKNIPRVVRLRNINKYRIDIEGENADVEQVYRFQKIIRNNELEIKKGVRRRTPPRYIKTNFRHKTLEKFKSLIGQYNNLGS